MDLKTWANIQYEKQKNTVRDYIQQGIDKKAAVKMVIESSTLGAGYKSQLRHEFNLSMFD